ncbi:alpha/beta fold hydrolase [Candidatus Woesearchaeota archaeon]|nr:alpha/beta fold hydrolase [Candidatus Woesearchaeota archaeon]
MTSKSAKKQEKKLRVIKSTSNKTKTTKTTKKRSTTRSPTKEKKAQTPNAKKQPIQTKKIRKIKKPSKKRLTKFFIIIPIAIILFLILFYIISINVKLLFDTETHIAVSPSIKHIAAVEKIPPNITFTTTVKKLAVCDIVCSFTLEDVSQGIVISSETRLSEKSSQEKFTLPLPKEVAGQSIFSYKVNCTTTQRNICPSKGKTYEQSAFVTVSYNLSTEEKLVQDVTQNLIEKSTTTFNTVQQTIYSLNATNKELLAYSDGKTIPKELFTSLAEWKTKQEQLFLIWEQGGLQDSESLAKEQQAKIATIAKQTDFFINSIINNRISFNQAMLFAQEIHTQRKNNSAMASYVQAVNAKAFKKINSANKSYELLLTQSTIFTPEELLKGMQTIKRAISELEENYTTLQKEELKQLQQLSSLTNVTAQKYNLSTTINSCSDISTTYATLLSVVIGNDSTILTDLIKFNNTYCQEFSPVNLFNATPLPKIVIQTIKTENLTLPKQLPVCCYQGDCQACKSTPQLPVILVHGHSFSKSTSPELAFTRMGFIQNSLAQDGYVHAGTLNAQADIDSISAGEWGKSNNPLAIRVTYYYLNYYELGQLSFTTRKTDRIENYAIRLKESIDTIRQKTNQDKVIIIAHSMGGLVTRSYLDLFGEDAVEVVILLGTPNHGIEGDIRRHCTLTGAQNECDDMEYNSPFIKRLELFTPSTTDFYTIAAVGCPTKSEDAIEDGDGVVLARSVALDYAKNYQITGTCTDVLQKSLHMDFVNTELYPETYTLIKQILNKYTS